MVPVTPLDYYRPWAFNMVKRCTLPLAPVSSHRLRWKVLLHMASSMGIHSPYLQTAFDVCHDMPSLAGATFSLPRYLPKYDQPSYPRARHAEVRDLGILTRAPDRHHHSLVHPWLLVPKSSGVKSRLVTDCSILTKLAYPTLVWRAWGVWQHICTTCQGTCSTSTWNMTLSHISTRCP